MSRKRKKNELRAGELNLTAMIDIAFQLLSFFIITVHPVDVLAHLDANRPSPDRPTHETQIPPNMIRVQVQVDGFSMNDRAVTEEMLAMYLQKLAALDPTQTILIVCAAGSPHSKLIEVLDLCAQYKLTNLSVVSGS